MTYLLLLNDIAYFLEDPIEIWREATALQNTAYPQELYYVSLHQPDQYILTGEMMSPMETLESLYAKKLKAFVSSSSRSQQKSYGMI